MEDQVVITRVMKLLPMGYTLSFGVEVETHVTSNEEQIEAEFNAVEVLLRELHEHYPDAFHDIIASYV